MPRQHELRIPDFHLSEIRRQPSTSSVILKNECCFFFLKKKKGKVLILIKNQSIRFQKFKKKSLLINSEKNYLLFISQIKSGFLHVSNWMNYAHLFLILMRYVGNPSWVRWSLLNLKKKYLIIFFYIKKDVSLLQKGILIQNYKKCPY